jgi:hypothetical protein
VRGRLSCLIALVCSTAAAAQEDAPIQDNSFLVEEAYNQEAGIVQHITTFQRGEGSWNLAFTQEWPFTGLRHQVGFTVQLENPSMSGGGLGDVWLNYRYQAVGSGLTRVAFAPRLSVSLPTGEAEAGRGSGSVGAQVNLPLSIVLSSSLVAHMNAGMTVFPSASGPGGSATTADIHAGAGLFWLLHPSFNVLLETLWLSEAAVTGPGRIRREGALLLSPGIRAAFTVGGVQVVPGAGYPIGFGARDGDDSLFLYLSLERAF